MAIPKKRMAELEKLIKGTPKSQWHHMIAIKQITFFEWIELCTIHREPEQPQKAQGDWQHFVQSMTN
jgi:hypothetical protein